MRPAVLVARAVPPAVTERLRAHFEVEGNDTDVVWDKAELTRRLQGKAGLFATGSERIDAALLDACPQIKAVCNMAVGYNNIDVDACTARGVLATNTPDVLTETTADFGFALMMATARRMAESERYLRAGEWKKWAYDMFTGSDVHGATLGILGMGRIGQAIARRGALGFGMKVIYHNRSRLAAADEAPLNARYVDKPSLFRESDHVVLVLPYSPSSHHAVAHRAAPSPAGERALPGGMAPAAAAADAGLATSAARPAAAAAPLHPHLHRRKALRRLR